MLHILEHPLNRAATLQRFRPQLLEMIQDMAKVKVSYDGLFQMENSFTCSYPIRSLAQRVSMCSHQFSLLSIDPFGSLPDNLALNPVLVHSLQSHPHLFFP